MFLRLAFIYSMLSFSGIAGSARSDQGKLVAIDADLQKSFPNIGHMKTSDLEHAIGEDSNIVLVDVRTDIEYAVGRIPGAIRIDPGASSKTVAELLSGRIEGKEVVFYCSVGVRSSRLANKAATGLKDLGAENVHNLSGGVFAWHNERRALENEEGSTALVHPYDRNWGKLLSRQEYVSTKPEENDAG